MGLLYLHEVKLEHNASKTAANINITCGEKSTSNRAVRWWFERFCGGDESLKCNIWNQRFDIGLAPVKSRRRLNVEPLPSFKKFKL